MFANNGVWVPEERQCPQQDQPQYSHHLPLVDLGLVCFPGTYAMHICSLIPSVTRQHWQGKALGQRRRVQYTRVPFLLESQPAQISRTVSDLHSLTNMVQSLQGLHGVGFPDFHPSIFSIMSFHFSTHLCSLSALFLHHRPICKTLAFLRCLQKTP